MSDRFIGMRREGEIVWVDYLEWLGVAIREIYGSGLDQMEVKERADMLNRVVIDTFNRLLD